MITRRLLLAAALLVAATPRLALASDISGESREFVRNLGDAAIASLTKKETPRPEREAAFRKLFVEGFDVAAIGRFALGRAWRTAEEAQRAEYLKLFEDAMVRVYTRRFEDYSGQTFTVVTSRSEGENHALVQTRVDQPGGAAPIRVDWRVLKPQGQLKVVDIVIEGVSMAVNQQQDFASLIQRGAGSLDGLFAHLKTQAAAP